MVGFTFYAVYIAIWHRLAAQSPVLRHTRALISALGRARQESSACYLRFGRGHAAPGLLSHHGAVGNKRRVVPDASIFPEETLPCSEPRMSRARFPAVLTVPDNSVVSR